MFLNHLWDQNAWNSHCISRWGIAPDIYYGQVVFGASKDPAFALRGVTNIVFSNGKLDPWHVGSVTETIHKDIVGFLMPGSAHFLDLMYPNDSDPQGVKDGRDVEKGTIIKWLQEYIA